LNGANKVYIFLLGFIHKPASASCHTLPGVNEVFGPIGYIVSMKDGIPSFVNRELDGLTQLGYTIDVYTTQVGRGLYSTSLPFARPSMPVLVLGNGYFLVFRPRRYFSLLLESFRTKSLKEFIAGAAFGRLIAKRHTRLIHSTFGDRKLFIGYYAHRLTDIPLTTMIHSHELAFYIETPIFSKALLACSAIFAICDWNRSELVERFPVLRDRIVVSRLFVDSSTFLEDERIKVLTVAKFHDYKGYDDLAKVAALLKSEKIVFWIVGEGPVDVKGLVRQAGADKNVVILGSVNEDVLKILYQSCDVFFLPSKTAPTGQKEGVPVTLMEAMAFSKPVVSTRNAGIPELVPSEIVDEGDIEHLAEAVRSYAMDPGKRRRDGERNRMIVTESYSPKNLDAFGESLKRFCRP